MKEKINGGEQSEEQVNIQNLLFRYLIHWPWFVVSIIMFDYSMGIFYV